MARLSIPLVLLAAVFSGSFLLAHGGQFRGPPAWNAPPGPPPTGGPGPAGPGPGGPTTGGRPSIADGTSWQVWFEFNREDVLAGTETPSQGPITGSDEFYLGPRRVPYVRDSQAPTLEDRRDRIAAALQKALATANNRDLVTACLVALAKVGIEPDGRTLGANFAPFLRAGDQEIRETAALAYGIDGDQSGYGTLQSLLRADAAGRVLSGGKDTEVPDRTRTFAAWSLGLMAGRSHDPALKRAAGLLLLEQLNVKGERSRDLRVGLIEGLGLLAPQGERRSSEKLLLWQMVDELWKYYDQDLGKGDQLVQAHAPTAIARLLGRGTSTAHQRAKARLAAELFADGRTNQIRQSAAMALGVLCLPQEEAPADAEFATALVRGYEKCADQSARFFCALALGRIGGDANRSALRSLYASANKSIERPWLALALGLVARERARRTGAVDAEIGRLLLRDLQAIEFEDAQSGIALALGLCGYRDAAPTLATMLREGGRPDTVMGYLPIALAMLGHADCCDDLVALMQKSSRRPFVLQQCAVALGRLGDARTVPLLLGMLDENRGVAALSAVANALATIRDRRSIDPLVELLGDPARPGLVRAFAAAALGGVGDKDELPWNAVIARDVNYQARVDTLTNGQNGVLDIL